MHGFSRSLEQDLRSITNGEAVFDPRQLTGYRSDRCWYSIIPLGVVYPRHRDEVSAVAAYCNDRGVPLIPRGAATGLAGQAVGMGLILDFTRHMNTILRLEPDSVSLEPGVVLQSLNRELSKTRRMFPIDPASAAECTIGGMIGTNAAGAHGVRYGAMKDHVESLSIVLANGEQAHVDFPAKPDSRTPTFAGIVTSLSKRLTGEATVIRSKFPAVQKNSSGYNLKDAVAESDIDVRKLIIGSEGTLAIVVEAELKTAPQPRDVAGALIFFDNYEAAVDATLLAIELGPAAVEFLDKTYMAHGSGFSSDTDRLIVPRAAVVLHVEFEGDETAEVQKSIMQLNRALTPVRPLRFLPLAGEAERQTVWQLREAASRSINSGPRKKASFIEDGTVPLKNLPEYIRGLRDILAKNDIEFSLYGHAASGNIHCATFVDLSNKEHYRRIDTVASEVCDLTVRLGGTLSGEHGDGFVRTPFLRRLYGPEVFELFRTVKRSFDPNNILNPGKITGDQNTTILHDVDLA